MALPPVQQINWAELGENFEDKSSEEILKHAATELLKQGHVIFLTAFGPEGCVLLHMLAGLIDAGDFERKKLATSFDDLTQSEDYKLAIVNLDTGYQFNETLELKEKLEQKYQVEILLQTPSLTVAEQDAKYGEDLFASDPDQCCYLRKLKPLAELLQNKLAWITSIRREQTAVRAKAKAFEFDKKFHLGKINPLIKWTKSDIWKYIHENEIPYNRLLDEGYESIGCEPCTSKAADRKGSRWAGKDKIECGLHIQDEEHEQGGEFVI